MRKTTSFEKNKDCLSELSIYLDKKKKKKKKKNEKFQFFLRTDTRPMIHPFQEIKDYQST